MEQLSHLLRDGQGIPKDEREAQQLVRKAAEIDYPGARFEVGGDGRRRKRAVRRMRWRLGSGIFALQMWVTQAASHGYWWKEMLLPRPPLGR
jgi:TPR repeat protein